MNGPLEPSKIFQPQAPAPVRRHFDGALLLSALGLFLVIAVFRAHETSLFLRIPALGAGELLAAIGAVNYRRSRPSSSTAFSLEAPTGPGTNVGVAFVVLGFILGSLFLMASAPGALAMLGMVASLALVVVGWGSMVRG